VKKFLELSSEEIEAIISEATPTNSKRATAWGVSLFKGEFLLFFCVVYTVKGDQILYFQFENDTDFYCNYKFCNYKIWFM
jgi:hypothetical protein